MPTSKIQEETNLQNKKIKIISLVKAKNLFHLQEANHNKKTAKNRREGNKIPLPLV
ncbi:hypothetical protein [Porphyromonas gingivalis]|uniref:hypothetical protein n=1 Tax=Porphyromonas gingivalis TaxID=837 RepID=UPI0002E15304|nr:hypothetical protein [Porphyromonas gingivalis]